MLTALLGKYFSMQIKAAYQITIYAFLIETVI